MAGASTLIRQIVDLHRRQLFGLIEIRGIKRMRRLYGESRRELEVGLAGLRRAGKGESFRAHHMRQVLVQVADAARGFEAGLGEHLQKTGHMAAVLAPRHVLNMVGKMEAHFGRTTPVIQAAQAAVVAGIDRRIMPSLLMHHRETTKLYGRPTILKIQEQLARAIVQNQPVDEVVDRVSGAAGLFEGQRYRAERIVRTELSYSYGVAAQAGMEDLRQKVPKMMKRLVATFDDRTGADSKELNGQTVPVDHPFLWVVTDSKGHKTGKIVKYMQPPNRPNDREVVIPWMEGWAAPASLTNPVEPTTRGLPEA